MRGEKNQRLFRVWNVTYYKGVETANGECGKGSGVWDEGGLETPPRDTDRETLLRPFRALDPLRKTHRQKKKSVRSQWPLDVGYKIDSVTRLPHPHPRHPPTPRLLQLHCGPAHQLLILLHLVFAFPFSMSTF